MSEPKYAQNMPGKGRWYVHPQTGEMWPSITNVLDMAVAKQHSLVPWAVKITVEMAIEMLPRLIAASLVRPCKPKRVDDECRKCRPCLIKQIKRAHKEARDKAADLGSRVHDWADGHLIGRPMIRDTEVEPFGKQLLQFFADFGVDLEKDIEATEATVVNRKVGYAGTGDLWVRLRIEGWSRKRLVCIDYKTSSTRPVLSAYPENAMQLAAIVNGETLLLDDGTEMPAPRGVKDVFVLALRTDSYALIPMPMQGSLDEAFAAFQGALRDAEWLHTQYGAKPVEALPVAAAKAVA